MIALLAKGVHYILRKIFLIEDDLDFVIVNT